MSKDKDTLSEQKSVENKQEESQDSVDKKKTLRTVIITIICTLLFIVIILLLVLLGIKQCSRATSSGPSSSEQSSAPRYDYDNEKLDNKFKAIVKSYMDGPGCLDPDNLLEVKAVTYVDNYDDGYFSLNISVTGESNKLYLYKANKVFYPEDKSRFDNLISYLLLEDTPNIFELGNDDTEYHCYTYSLLQESITTDKVCRYVISKDVEGTTKYLDGFYYEDNQYCVYHHQQLISSNPFNEQADLIVDYNHPLYGYYQKLVA